MGGSTTTQDRPPGAETGGAVQQLAPGLNLIRPLARGGFAEVWEAEQVSLGRKVAVKILRSELLGQQRVVRLFEQESRVLARLNHPNVVQVIDRGTSTRGPYFVMEHVDGQTFQDLIGRGKLERGRALMILMQAARGLAYAHRNRVIHRDVKPANILVALNGPVKITDFGIAAVLAAAGEKTGDDTGASSNTRALGTRAFMAPEQRSSFDAVGPAADVYSLGVILHRIVAGKLPPAPGEIDRDITLDPHLAEILEKALALDPEDRYPNAGAFREALVNVLEGDHIEDGVKDKVTRTIPGAGRFELLDVLRQDAWRSVYLVRRGGEDGECIIVKRYLRDEDALRAVRGLVQCEHPNIVRIHTVAEREDSFIMLMEHLSGGDLRERLAKPHPWPEVARVGRAVASALAHAHRRGIVHGNLRPSNILFDDRGGIRVADFGLREHYRGEAGKRNWYAAPEGGRSIPSDLYALGAILFEMLYATAAPESAAEQAEVMERRKDIPLGMLDLVKRLLAPAGQRCASADAALHDLKELGAAEGEHAAPRAAEPPTVPAKSTAVARRWTAIHWIALIEGLLLAFVAGRGVLKGILRLLGL